MAMPGGCSTVFNPGWEANMWAARAHVCADGSRLVELRQYVLVACAGARQPPIFAGVGQGVFGHESGRLEKFRGSGFPKCSSESVSYTGNLKTLVTNPKVFSADVRRQKSPASRYASHGPLCKGGGEGTAERGICYICRRD